MTEKIYINWSAPILSTFLLNESHLGSFNSIVILLHYLIFNTLYQVTYAWKITVLYNTA